MEEQQRQKKWSVKTRDHGGEEAVTDQEDKI